MGTIIISILLIVVGIPLLILVAVVIYTMLKTSKENREIQEEIDRMEKYKPIRTNVSVNHTTSDKTKSGKEINSLTFPVVGLNYEGRRQILKKIINQYKAEDYFFETYEGMSNKEIKENTFDERIYELNYESLPTCKLVKEDDNKYDPNAIMVIIKDIYGVDHHIGYVPREHCLKVREVMDKHEIEIMNTITGGKYKIVDYDDYGEEKVRTRSIPFGLNIFIKSGKSLI